MNNQNDAAKSPTSSKPEGKANQGNTLHTQSGKKDNATLKAAIKKEWSKLSDEDVNLYETQKDTFFKKIEEKHQIVPEVSRKKLKELEASTGCGTEKAA